MFIFCTHIAYQKVEEKKKKGLGLGRPSGWEMIPHKDKASWLPSCPLIMQVLVGGPKWVESFQEPQRHFSPTVVFRLWGSQAGRTTSWETALLSSGQNAFGCSFGNLSETTDCIVCRLTGEKGESKAQSEDDVGPEVELVRRRQGCEGNREGGGGTLVPQATLDWQESGGLPLPSITIWALAGRPG